MDKRLTHINALDGVRAFAIMMVCVAHFFQVHEISLYQEHRMLGVLLFKLSQLGLTGVELFFLLSGFLITNILIDSRASPAYYKTFYMRRILRIFPLYYFILLVSFIVLPWCYTPDMAGLDVIDNQWWLWSFLSNISFVFNKPELTWDGSNNYPHFGHFWSLAVEEHFYIIWPFIINNFRDEWLSRVMLGFVALSLAVVFLHWWPYNQLSILEWGTLSQSGMISLGGWLALKWRQPNSFMCLVKLARTLVLPALLFFVFQTFIPRSMELKPLVRQLACFLLFPAVIVLAIHGNSIACKVFCHKVLYFIGKLSYGIYIYHGWLRPYFKALIYQSWLQPFSDGIAGAAVYTVISTLISIGIAYVSWILLESPFLGLKRMFRYQHTNEMRVNVNG